MSLRQLAMDVQAMFRGRGEPVCSPNRGADESEPMRITVLSLNIYSMAMFAQRQSRVKMLPEGN